MFLFWHLEENDWSRDIPRYSIFTDTIFKTVLVKRTFTWLYCIIRCHYSDFPNLYINKKSIYTSSSRTFSNNVASSHPITWGAVLIISLFPDHSLRPEKVASTIEVLHYETAFLLQTKPRPLLLGFNPLSPGIKLQILLLCFHTFLTKVVGRSC